MELPIIREHEELDPEDLQRHSVIDKKKLEVSLKGQ